MPDATPSQSPDAKSAPTPEPAPQPKPESGTPSHADALSHLSRRVTALESRPAKGGHSLGALVLVAALGGTCAAGLVWLARQLLGSLKWPTRKTS